jgi:hypothetical protein
MDKTHSDLEKQRDALQDQAGRLDPNDNINSRYNPNKRRRAIRRQVYERYYLMRDDQARQLAEADWEVADKEYRMTLDAVDADDWRSHLQLPDAFAAISAQMQETIERKARPTLTPTEDDDQPIADFSNSVIKYNMDNTGYDYQYYLAKLNAAIRGTSFLMDYWRVEKRVVKDPTGLKDGVVEYTDKEIVDFDDDYTEWVPNEFIFVDEKAKHIDEAVDMFRREILNIEEFHRLYDNRPGYYDTKHVYPGGETTTRSFFQLPRDITIRDVEVLHYYNRSIDAYWVVANNVVIYDCPLPWKHKELPIAVLYQYRVPGHFFGFGIPKIIHVLSEERKTIRNLNMDRQKLQIGGAFLHNKAYDLDDEDTTLQPGRFIGIETNGQRIDDAIKKLEFGDVPASYFRTEEILLEDIHRATGIDDRVLGTNVGGTATEAAILKESALKRVNYISITAEMDCVIRLGKLKWSNLQFFYPIPRMEKIYQGNEEKQQKVYRSITVDNRKFEIIDDGGAQKLRMNDVRGKSALKLKPEYAKFMEGNFDISVDADIFTPVSKAIEQTKKTELFSVMTANPATMGLMDLNGAMADVLQVNNVKPDRWLRNPDGSRKDMMMLAENENVVMAAGQPLTGTENATEDHTLVHLMFAKTQEFQALPHEIQQTIMDHILQEHDANPATGAAGELMGAYGLGQPGPGGPAGAPPPGGATGGAALPAPGIQANTNQPQPQVADLQATSDFSNRNPH